MSITLRLRYERRNAWLESGSGKLPHLRGGGQQNLECGPLPHLTIDGNRPIHPLDHVFHDGKPQTGASDLTPVVDSLVKVALEQRQAARARKDFAASDAIRDQLAAAGVLVEDTPSGPRWTLKS